jgi:CheY-like chemotaxis protein
LARKILLADDSVTAQNMGRRILTDAGYEVVTVNNGSAALKKIAEQKPDLIVLDVYMPGYGGLEVCARLKENKETARIPVLLSVGKLEPFKAEEARRVRAEGYIVKPFEASELLTALTRLEDKIVPGPEPYKPGRFAKAIAAVEGSSEHADQFGDKESGWKDRLTLPKRSKKKSAAAEDKEPEVAEVRTFPRDREKPVEPPREFERPIPAGLPADITPEEISAITAAAAALNQGQRAETAFVPSPGSADPGLAGEAVRDAEPASPADSSSEVTPAAVVESVVDAKLATHAEAAAEPVAPEEAKPTDAEVLAALAMLGAPGSDNETVAVGVAEAAMAGATYSGPRWVAEEVTIQPEDASFILEHEMQKAYAAMAAVEGAHTRIADVAEEPFATPDAAMLCETAAVPDTSAVTPAEPVTSAAPEPVSAVEIGEMPGAAPELAPEAAEPLVSEGGPTPEIPAEVVAEAQVEPQLEAPAEVQSEAPAEAQAEAPMAFAAAVGGEANLAVSPMTSEMTSAVAESVASAPEVRGESELASAWANWHQIRETVMGPGDSAVATEAPAPEPVGEPAPEQPEAAAQPAEAVPEPAEETAEASEAGEAEAISSIVDNMLAELKPRLMEELSKKLKKDKKK